MCSQGVQAPDDPTIWAVAIMAIAWQRISAAGVVVAVAAAAALASPWSNSIPPAHLNQSFGFQTPACWIVVAALGFAVLLDERWAVAAIGVAAAVILGWLGWAMWAVTTRPFSALPFSFMGTDVIGPGWYAAAAGLLLGAVIVIRRLIDRQAQPGADLWVLTAIPGYGLMRLGRWARGAIFAALVDGAFYFGSTDSPDASVFVEYGRSNNVPPPIPRGPEWVLLAFAAGVWLLSILATIVERQRQAKRRSSVSPDG